MKAARADALLFDIGNVIYGIDFDRALACWAAHAACAPALLTNRFTVDAAFRRHEIGEITDAEFFAALRSMLQIELSDDQLLEGWNAIFLDEPAGISAALKEAAACVPLYAFSNTDRAHEAFLSRKYAGLLAHFRKLFLSSTIGLRKPDAEAFRHVVKEIGVPAERIVFFDDSIVNVEAARACSLQPCISVRWPMCRTRSRPRYAEQAQPAELRAESRFAIAAFTQRL
jgi:putative hydrolase of the HAD superfamily